MPAQGGIKAGKIIKSYGLRGDLYLITIPEVIHKIEVGIPLFIDIDGQRVPFFVEEITPVSPDQLIIKFEFINRLEEARAVCGFNVYLDQKTEITGLKIQKDFHAIEGYQAFDQSIGPLGKVVSFIENEYNPLLVIDYKGRELMVPAAAEIILEINHNNNSVQLKLPDGLTDL